MVRFSNRALPIFVLCFNLERLYLVFFPYCIGVHYIIAQVGRVKVGQLSIRERTIREGGRTTHVMRHCARWER